ncbi:D-glycero-beta-D-manno-heptose 1-phosphate adenylyltransferase [Aquisphaera giovannonii]|uniref:D-glycero-beta-D-manno-heptose 1-phosphate adenylyltransferase n=1 Tax=Aquisphaera giovannonii TaxID=406548 RepID=UPI001AEF9FDB|nr:D-glycero-beta-D-manno-heptose 1-phosphate adenylyltransferase [Aquisphaera giovannonii]
MSTSLPRIVDAFAGLHVLVIGESMLDCYLQGSTSRLCPEAPVPIVDFGARSEQPGGAANSAFNALCLGAEVSFLSVVGDDPEGESVVRQLARRGIDPADVLSQRGRRTLAKQRVLAGSQLLLRLDSGDTGPISPEVEDRLVDRLVGLWRRCDAAVVSDYGYGVLSPRVIGKLGELQSDLPRILVVDSKRLALYRDASPTAVKPNCREALRLLDVPGPSSASERVDWMAARGARILDISGARIASVTLDSEGALVFERDRPAYRTFAKADRDSRVAGAGDTFAATIALALAAGAETPAAADLASAASAVVIGKEGTATCSAAELRDRVSPAGKSLADRAELADCVAGHRRLGRRIVFTNGCFDILHRGHISYLSRAKALGDVLIVGVNSDEGIRRLKGPTRPINALEDRLQVLSALSCVDHVIPFDEPTPHELIRVVRPDTFVKGGDYTRATLPEASLVEEFGGTVEILSFLADRSTTDIIARIRRAYGEGAGGADGHPPLGAAADTWADHAPALGGGNGV